MNPFEGQRRLEVRAEQVVWHLVSAGVLGLLLLVLVVSVSLLEGARAGATPAGDAPPRVARPVEEGAVERAVLETSQRCEPAVPVAYPGEGGLPLDRVRLGSAEDASPIDGGVGA